MSDLMNLMLLYGGKSGEHEISLISAASVLTHLNRARYRVIPVGIDKEGRLYENNFEELLTYNKALPVHTERSRPLESLLKDGHLAIEADVVFPMVHGPLYEDGCLQGLLELASVAYVGCDVLSSAIGMDKEMARRLIKTPGIKTARYCMLSWHTPISEIESFCRHTAAELGWPLFVKPCSLGSSVGIHKATTLSELMEAVADARRYDKAILVEEYIEGREIELSVLENSSPAMAPKVSKPGEICVHHRDGFYSYTAKYLESEQTELSVPANLSDSLTQRLEQAAGEIFTSLKCRGMARIDFFVNAESGDIYFNEINTLPGFTAISMYPKLWEASGIPYKELLDRLIESALAHHRCRQQLVTHYQ